MRQKVEIIVDLQYGSCGKGLMAGWRAKQRGVDTLVTAWAPNAGHTFIDSKGEKFVHCAIPNGVVSDKLERILIGPGSVINPDLMESEIKHLQNRGYLNNVEIVIHPYAAVVFEEHRQEEACSMAKIGSTMKGVGAAVIQKIRRDPDNMNVACVALRGTELFQYVVPVDEYHAAYDKGRLIQVEGAQGYSISMNHGFYPYTTSRDCTVLQTMSDCGLPFVRDPMIIGVARTFPIRVNNRGYTSGPCYPDQIELTWEQVGVEPELTTVTKLPRRVFSWSPLQIKDAIRANNVDAVFLNFCNYARNKQIIQGMERDVIEAGSRVLWYGYGPTENDITHTIKE